MANENRPRAGFLCQWNLLVLLLVSMGSKVIHQLGSMVTLLKIEIYLCLQTGNLQLELECWTVGKKGTMRRAKNMGFTITQLLG